jgi:hypothetical protein
MKIRLSTVLACIVLSAPALSATPEPHLRGTVSCAQWTWERGRQTALYERAWLLGYLSAVSVKAGKEFWGPGKGAEPDRLENEATYQWMDMYCRANPLKDVDDGAEVLFVERTSNLTDEEKR